LKENRFSAFFEGARLKIESFDVITDSKDVCFTIKCLTESNKECGPKLTSFWITRDESSSTIVSSAEGKRTERFSEKSSRYRDFFCLADLIY
jgi:hypothetical protein